jgi:hypothetical protein
MLPRAVMNASILDHPDILRIQEAFERGTDDLVLFAGAGLSEPLGFPLWEGLLRQLIDHGLATSRIQSDEAAELRALVGSGQFLLVGDRVRKRLGPRLEEKLRAIFERSPGQFLGLYEYLVRLPWRGYITTNYDRLLEMAFVKHHGRPLVPVLPGDTRALGSLSANVPFLLKLHGDVSRGSYVFGQKDYSRLYSNGTLKRFLYSVFFHHTVVFLGYGITDMDIVSPLRLLAGDYRGSSPRHIALISHKEPIARLTELEDSTCINCVPYDPADAHALVGAVVTTWSLASERHTGSPLSDPVICADLLRRRTPRALSRLSAGALELRDWLAGDIMQRYLTERAPAAIAAEAIIAMKAAERAFGVPSDPGAPLARLHHYRDASGGVVSHTLGAPTVHATALAAHAFRLVGDTESEARDACEAWLRMNLNGQVVGWDTFGRGTQVRTVPSAVALGVLAASSAFPAREWERFRDYVLTDGGLTAMTESSTARQVSGAAAAAWVLWAIARIRSFQRSSTADDGVALKALQRLLKSSPFEQEHDRFGLPHSGIRVSWHYETAACVVIGTAAWVAWIPEAWEVLGLAVSRIVRDLERGDLSAVQSLEPTAVFPNLYRLWALSECHVVIGAV